MSSLRFACYLCTVSLMFYGISVYSVIKFLETTKCLP